MPWVEPNEDLTLVADGVPPPTRQSPGVLDTLGAAFRQDNEVVSLYRRMNDEHFPPDPNYNPLPDIQGTKYFQFHADRFAGVTSPAEADVVKHRIDEEEADRATLDAAGFGGTLAQFAAGTLNPTTWLIPGGTAKAGLTGLRTALRTGALFGAGAAISETILQGTHETRTWGESATTVAAATVLGGLIGPATLARMSPAERAAAEHTLTMDRIAMAEHAGDKAGADQLRMTLQPAGAAVSDARPVTPVRTILGTALDRFDPMSRIFGAKSVSARQALADLAEVPTRMEQNLQGAPTTSTGAPAVSRVVTMVQRQREVALYDEVHRLWTEYRFGEPTTLPRLRDKLEQFQGRAEGYMTFEEFDAEIAKAARRGDTHDIPQVQQAAQFMRKHYDEWKERAIGAGLFPEDVKPKGADSYLNRLWNKPVIAARRNEFVDKVTEYYRGDQTTKMGMREKLVGLNRDLQSLDDALTKARTPDRQAALAAERTALRKQIEETLGQWQGRSANAAKSAIKAREKYAATKERAEDADPLASADKAIDDWVKHVLRKKELSDAELRARAEETTDRILSSADGRLSYESNSGAPSLGFKAGEPPRGPLAERRFAIPDAMVEDFLEHSALYSHRAYLRTIVPDVLLTERYGDTAMTEAFRKINDDYTALRQGASEKTLKRLEKERQRVIDDLASIRDRIRGVYGFSSDAPMRTAARVANAVKNYNTISLMGMSAISSLPDMAGSVFRHGLARSFGDAWAPFLSFVTRQDDTWLAAAKQFRAMGIATESFSSSRMHALADINDLYRPNSPVERALSWGADRFQLVNMLGPWTDWAKINASMVAGSEILRATKAVAAGTATKKQIALLGESNIDPTMATRIWAAFEKGGEVRKGVHLPNTADWTDAQARLSFEGAVSREADIAVLTPGQEKQLWISSPILSVLGQFKSFTLSATQRILLANLQRSDAQTLQGVIFAMGLGMLSYKLNNTASGRKTSDRPQDWVKEGIDRSGLLGWLGEGNALAAKATRGGVDVYRLIGADKPLSRYASRSILDHLIGPTAGKIEALSRITGAAASGEWNAGDTSALRRLQFMQNTFWLRRLFDEVEQSANRHLGVER